MNIKLAIKLTFAITLVCVLGWTIPMSFANELDLSNKHEAQVNSFTQSSQSEAAIAELCDGGLAVVWHSRRQQEGTYGVYMQRFASDGAAVGSEQQVNIFTDSMQMKPAIASDATGSVWVAWESFGQDGSLNAIIARRFTGDQFTGSDEIRINQSTIGNQSSVVVASPTNDQTVFFWVSTSKDKQRKCIYGRAFDNLGKPLCDEFVVATSSGHQSSPSVSSANGKLVIAWAEQDRFGRAAGIYGKLLSVSGDKLEPNGNTFSIAKRAEVQDVEPAISMSADGSFAVSWQRSHESEYEVCFQNFDANAKPISDSVRATAPSARYVNGAAVESGPRGQYMVTWNQQTDDFGEDINIFGQLFNSKGGSVGSVFPINENQKGRHQIAVSSGKRRLIWDSHTGNVVVAWHGRNDNDKSSVNVTALVKSDQKFQFQQPVGEPTEDVESTARPHEPPTFNPKFIAKDPFGGFEPLGPAGKDFGFVAINATGWNPPDPVVAVGPNHVIAMTNGAIAFFDKSGNLTFSDQIEGASGFWSAQGAGGFVFDPEVLFDPHSNRYFAMANERTDNRSFFLIAVSDDDNPNGTWFRYRLDVTDIADSNIDSPNFAVDDEVVYLTADFFGPDRFLVYMLRKSDLLVGDPVVDSSLLINGSHSYGVPMTYDTDAPAFYMIQAFEFGNFNNVRFHAVTDPLSNPQRVTTDVAVPTYGNPQDPVQLGTSSRPELFEARFWSCVYRNGSLWAVHHHSPNSTDIVRVRWYEFAMNDWPASGQQPQLVQSGELAPSNQNGQQSAVFFPSIWVDDLGNAAITMSRSSASEFISMSRAVRSASDPLGTMQEIELVQASTSPFTGGRWGDYSGTMDDPAEPNTFWGIHEFAQNDGFWQTYIARYVVGNAVTTVESSSVDVNPGTIVAGDFLDLASDDGDSVIAHPAPDEIFEGPGIGFQMLGNSVDTQFNTLSVKIRSSVNSPNLVQQVEIFDFVDQTFVVVDTRDASQEFETIEVDAPGDVSRFTTPATGTLLARVKFFADGPVLIYPWQVSLDQFIWQHSE